MSLSHEVLTLEHEKTVAVVVRRCDGPGCDNAYRYRDLSVRHRRDEESFTDETSKGWWYLGPDDPGMEVPFEFCSWACVKAAMLGMPEPTQ